MATDSEYIEPTYGNWRVPRSSGIGKLGAVATVLLFAAMIIGVFILASGHVLAALAFGVAAVIVISALTWTDRDGVNLLMRIVELGAHMFRKKTKRNAYRSGPLGMSSQPGYQLPGVTASATPYTVTDSLQREFGMVHMPAVASYSVSIAVEPDGGSMVDQESIDQWVADWGGFLGSLGRETGLQGVSATVETSPGSGVQVRQEIEAQLSDGASELARHVLTEAANDYPSGGSQITCWVTLSFSASPRPGMKRRSPEEMGRELASKLPTFTARLESTGAGVATPMTIAEISRITRIAYDPASARLFDDAYYEGETVPLPWNEIGPSAHEAEWKGYRHDSGVSVCWSMTEAPRGHTYSNVLGRLVAPHPDIARKRVTMIYRPIDASQTSTVVERDQNQAQVRASSSNTPNARAQADLEAARATAREEARGAGLTFFGMLVSATVTNEHDLTDAVVTVEQELAPATRISLRRAYGSHDAVFAATLPLGVVLGHHAALPETVKVAM